MSMNRLQYIFALCLVQLLACSPEVYNTRGQMKRAGNRDSAASSPIPTTQNETDPVASDFKPKPESALDTAPNTSDIVYEIRKNKTFFLSVADISAHYLS